MHEDGKTPANEIWTSLGLVLFAAAIFYALAYGLSLWVG